MKESPKVLLASLVIGSIVPLPIAAIIWLYPELRRGPFYLALLIIGAIGFVLVASWAKRILSGPPLTSSPARASSLIGVAIGFALAAGWVKTILKGRTPSAMS